MKDALTYAHDAGFFSFNVVGWKAEFERLIEAVRADALAELATVNDSLTVQDHIRDATKKVAEPVAWLYDWEHEGEIVTGWVTQDFETTKFNNGHNVRPLYAAPQPPNANIRSASEYSEQEPIGYVIQDDNYDGSKIRAEPVSGCCLPVYLAAPPQPNEERQEPVATLYRYVKDNMEPMTEWKACAEWPMIESRGLEIIPLYTAQPQREWIEPSDEQIAKINGFYSQASFETIAHAALALAKELNHG